MLKTLLNLFSIEALVCAGLVFVLCTSQGLEYAHNNEKVEESSIIEIFQNLGVTPKENDQNKVSPLVNQAGEFALFINPPAPPEVKNVGGKLKVSGTISNLLL